MSPQKCFTLFCKTVLTIISSALYMFDFFSDLVLGISYLMQGDTNWGIVTLVFTLVPYLIQLIGFGLLTKDTADDQKPYAIFVFIASVFGLGPVACSISGLIDSFRGKDDDAKGFTTVSSFARSLIIIIEDFPQLCLQIYVIGRTNHASGLQIAVILTSFMSGGKGLLNLPADYVVGVENKKLTILKEVLYNLVMVPFISLMILSFIPAVALYSSLHPYIHAANLSLLLYFIVHLILIFVCLVVKWKHNCYRLSSLILQIIFFIVCNVLAARWFVSVAPLLPISQQNATASIPGVPSYVWPEPMPLLETWMYQFPNATENMTYPDWANLANCTLARETNSNFGMTDLKNITDVFTEVQSLSLCVTDYSDKTFVLITRCSVILIAFHFILVFAYPRLHEFVWKTEDNDEKDDNDNDDAASAMVVTSGESGV